MIHERAECERLIAESPVFILDKEQDYSGYKQEAYKLVEYLYCYLMLTSRSKYEPYGLEITEVAIRCISNYKPDKGVFLHYFNSAWKKEYGHLVGDELIKESFQGIHFTKEQCRNYKKLMKYAQSRGSDTDDPIFNLKLAEVMGITIEDLGLLKEMVECKPVSGIILNDDGDEYSIIDQVDSGACIETEVIVTEDAIEYFKVVQSVFDGLQDRQKPMIAKLLTAKLSLLVEDNPSLLKVFQSTSFFDDMIFHGCISKGSAIEAKEISEMLGVAEASTSRAWKGFKDKLRLAALKREL